MSQSRSIEDLVNGTMEVYQNLCVTGSTPEDINEFVANLNGSVAKTSDWAVDKQTAFDTSIVFHLNGRRDLPSAKLSFDWLDDHSIYISNIVPDEISQFSYSQYNSVLMDFYSRFIEHSCVGFKLDHLLSEAHVPITNWISERAAVALAKFALNANQSTGTDHPYDQKRWLEFLFFVHDESVGSGGGLPASILRRWFSEVADWHHEAMTWKLAGEFENSSELLAIYDRYRASLQVIL